MAQDAIRKANTDDTRLIAVHVRPHGFAYIVLESTNVLDCGSRGCQRPDAPECLSLRFHRILIQHSPAIVIVNSGKRTQRPLSQNDARSAIARALRRVCKTLRVDLVELNSTAIQAHFAVQNARTKYEIACAVATFLPELAWKLPPQRKAWESEHYRMAIFDAAALALAYAGRHTPPTTLA